MAKKLNLSNRKAEKVLIVYREGTSKAREIALELLVWLRAKGLQVFGKDDQSWPEGTKSVDDQSIDHIDLVVVLGGDGTYLEAVRFLGGRNIPILGVNMGSLGFLTETRLENLHETLDLTLTGKMEMRPRSMIRVEVRKEGGRNPEVFSALNDVVIERGGGGHMITLSIFCENQHVSDYKADGLIVASPTGSTAYNLASGGPILHPEAHSIVVTPICPHSLTNRPIIFPDEVVLKLQLRSEQRNAILTLDGQFVCNLSSLDEVLIERDKCDHLILRRPGHNYFDLLREKLNFGARAVF